MICVQDLRNLIKPSSWPSCISPTIPAFKLIGLTIFLAFALSHLLSWTLTTYETMQDDRRPPFPFMNLPRELRDMVYEHLIEDPIYPPPPTSQQPTSSLSWVIPERWSSLATLTPTTPKASTWIFLASKQVHKEYTTLQCKRATFHLTVSPQNYNAPTTHPPSKNIWNISSATSQRIRSCSLQLVTTSRMLGVTDPRQMSSADWKLATQIRHDLSAFTQLKHFTLDAKAIGDPLWNPLWIWFHACQSFKNMGGPRLDRITFSLDTWSPGENYLARDGGNGGAWTWYCMEGHGVGLDGGADVTVREFCAKLYRQCRVCRVALESGDESDGGGA